MATMEVKCNFVSVFAKYDTVDELKAVANNICGQVKEAFESRVAEIKAGNSGAVVEVEVSTGNEAKTGKESKSTKAKDKKTCAKEIAEKLKKQEKAKIESKKENVSEDVIELTDTTSIKKLGLKFEKYNDKCWVLRGETKPLRKVLKEQFKGVFNSHLTGGDGWVFRTANVQECAKALGFNVKVA